LILIVGESGKHNILLDLLFYEYQNKDLESLTRSLKAFKLQDKKPESPLDALSSEDLLRLLKGDFPDGSTIKS
jgi:hypothetical protein